MLKKLLAQFQEVKQSPGFFSAEPGSAFPLLPTNFPMVRGDGKSTFSLQIRPNGVTGHTGTLAYNDGSVRIGDHFAKPGKGVVAVLPHLFVTK